AEDGIRDELVNGVQTRAPPICRAEEKDMTLKIILAAVTGQDTDAATLGVATALARKFNAHIEALHVKGDPRDAIPFLGEGASGEIGRASCRERGERAARAR